MNIGKAFNKENSSQLYNFLSSYFTKMKGEKIIEPHVKLTDSIVSATGGLIAMLIISTLAVILGYPMVLGPMGASCLLVFAVHAGSFSQPRPIFGGHFLATLTALTIWDFFGRSHLTIGITLAVVVFLMVILKVVHPPAAASAMVAINTQAGWGFLLTIALSSLLLIAISVIYNNLFKERQYPKQWL
jgi:CBS-domain-containing membrane protein